MTFLRPAYELLLGTDSLFDKIRNFFHYANITLHCRDFLKPLVRDLHPDLHVNHINTGAPCLFINGRCWLTPDLYRMFAERETEHDHLWIYQGQIVAALVRGENLEFVKNKFKDIPSNKEIIHHLRPRVIAKELDQVSLVSRIWDLVTMNSKAIEKDFEIKNVGGIIKGDVRPFAVIYEENNVFIDKNAVIEDFVVLNASTGPIYIEEGVVIEAYSRIQGPAFIGRESRIIGARLLGSSIGQQCKIGGEVSNSVISRFSNKAHHGFIGHSYLGEWVNLGAQTTNSNLKNTYGSISLQLEEEKVSTNLQFLGSFLGDHVKTGIGTLLDTGTIVGFGSSIFGPAIHHKYIPPFSWGSAGSYEQYQLKQFFTTAEKMMARRHVELKPGVKEIVTQLYQENEKKNLNSLKLENNAVLN